MQGDETLSSSLRARDSAFTKALDPDYEAAMRESSRSEMNKKFFADEKSVNAIDNKGLLKH